MVDIIVRDHVRENHFCNPSGSPSAAAFLRQQTDPLHPRGDPSGGHLHQPEPRQGDVPWGFPEELLGGGVAGGYILLFNVFYLEIRMCLTQIYIRWYARYYPGF